MSRLGAAWSRFWFEPVSTSPIAVFRIVFGFIVVGWTLSLGHDLFAFYTEDGIYPEQPGYWQTGWRGVWGVLGFADSGPLVVAVWLVLLAAAVALTLGLFTRVAALLVFVGVMSFERRNPFVFNSGDGLIRILAFYLMLAPSGAALSLDRLRSARDRFWDFPARAPWAMRLIQVQISILYIAAVWSKLRGTTWNDGTAVSYSFRIADVTRFPLPEFVTDSLAISNAMTYGTLLIEFSLGVLIWNRFLRPWVILGGIALHGGIDYATRVGFFSYAVMSAYIVFVPPERMDQFLLALRSRLARSRLPQRLRPRGESV